MTNMLHNKLNKTNILVYLGLFLIAFSLVWTSTLNPFTNRILNVDTSVYITITQELSRGLVLYRDLVDNKGPLLYFMSLPGFLVGGLTGVWVTQQILMFLSILFIYKTALLFTGRKTAFLTVFFTSLAMHPFYYVHAGAEEYSLPFLAISFYIFTKHYLTDKKTGFFELLVLGFCFAWSIMIRLNMFPLWAGFCLVIIIESIIKKRFIDIIKYIGAFSFGMIIVFLPVYLYFMHHNIVEDFYLNVIMGGAERGFQLSLQGFVNNFYVVINRSFSFIPLCIGIIWIFVKYKNINNFYFFGFLLSYFLSIIFLSFATGYSYYNLILIPFFVPAIAFLSDTFLNHFKVKYKHLALFFLFCVAFSEGIARFSFYLFFRFDSAVRFVEAGRLIDEITEPGDKIISLGGHAYIYPYTARTIASRFFFQTNWHIPGAREDFISDILNNRPRVITFLLDDDGSHYSFMPDWHADIYVLLETYYTLVSYESGIKIFLRD